MPVLNFARLAPASIGDDELNRRPVLRHELAVQFHGIGGRVKQKSPIPMGQEIAQVEGFSGFPSHPHLAVHERFQREPARVAAALQLVDVEDETNFGG